MSSDRDSLAYGSHLLPLAAMWGASYLFIEIAIEELEPATLVEIRLLLASALLAGVLVARMGIGETYRGLKRIWRSALILGLLNAAVPFTLISWGQTRVDSGIAAITVATVPIFVVLLAARFQPTERVRGARLVGILLGLAGVGVLAGVNPVGGLPAVVGIIATTTASFLYAGGTLYTQIRLDKVSPILVAFATSLGGALLLLPWAAVEAPSSAPSWKVIGAVVALAVFGTALAQIIYYRMLPLFGSTRSSLIAYLVPPVALIYGTLILDEPVTLNALLGLGLVLLGIGLGSGMLTRRRGLGAQLG